MDSPVFCTSYFLDRVQFTLYEQQLGQTVLWYRPFIQLVLQSEHFPCTSCFLIVRVVFICTSSSLFYFLYELFFVRVIFLDQPAWITSTGRFLVRVIF